VFDADGVKIVCDSKSLLYLDNMLIDYSRELVGGGFRFVNPNASGSCGCGTSFSV
jgi:iron-sulfur cluster assembly accessory protein